MESIFKLFDFNISNNKLDENTDEEDVKYQDTKSFNIQMFGINEIGETASILIEDFKPFFYVKVGDNWNMDIKNKFLESYIQYLTEENINFVFDEKH
jgi:hypothetical protein